MPEPLLYLKAMAAAALASMLVVRIATSLRSTGAAWVNPLYVLAMASGLAIGSALLALPFTWPPANGLDRLFMIGLPATLIVELIAGLPRVPLRWAWWMRTSLAATLPALLLYGSTYLTGIEWPHWQAAAVIAVSGACLTISWSLVAWLFQRSPGTSLAAALGLSTLCAGVTIMMAGYISGGAAAFPLAATLVAVAIGVEVTVTGASPRCGMPAILGTGVVGLFGLLFVGTFFGRVSPTDALALLLAPLLCWGTEVPFLRRRPGWIVGMVRMAMVAIPLIYVLVAAKREFDREMAPLLGDTQDTVLVAGQP